MYIEVKIPSSLDLKSNLLSYKCHTQFLFFTLLRVTAIRVGSIDKNKSVSIHLLITLKYGINQSKYTEQFNVYNFKKYMKRITLKNHTYLLVCGNI